MRSTHLGECGREASSFQFISVGGAAINFVSLYMLATLVGIDYRIANIPGILMAFVWNFAVNRRVTWKKQKY